MAGKGSRRRPTNEELYRENYSRIFEKDKKEMTDVEIHNKIFKKRKYIKKKRG